MHRLLPLALLALGCGSAPPAPERPAKAKDGSAEDVTAVADGVNAFGFNLFFGWPGDGNRFLSPYSLATALSMTYAGARGATADETWRC